MIRFNGRIYRQAKAKPITLPDGSKANLIQFVERIKSPPNAKRILDIPIILQLRNEGPAVIYKGDSMAAQAIRIEDAEKRRREKAARRHDAIWRAHRIGFGR